MKARNIDANASLTQAFLLAEPKMRQEVALYLQSEDDIDDVLYEAYGLAYDTAQTETIDAPATFLIKTARHLARTHLKQLGIQTKATSYAAQQHVIDNVSINVEDELVSSETLQQLDNAIQKLPSACQRVVLLRCKKHLSYKEIASTLNISIKTVEKHLTSAVKRCTNLLSPLYTELNKELDKELDTQLNEALSEDKNLLPKISRRK